MSDNYTKEELEELNSFGCPLWAEIDLDNILSWMKEEIYFYINENSCSPVKTSQHTKSKFLPRFGIYSVLLENLSVFIFDNPILEKTLGTTACTDGINIFINFNFYKELCKLEDESKTGRLGIAPLILHELNHILQEDIIRLKNIPHQLANITQDLYGNAYLKKTFSNLEWLPFLMDIGYGLKSGDEHYAEQTAEQIYLEVEEKLKTGKSPKLSKEKKAYIYSDKFLPEEKGRSIDKIENESMSYKNNENHLISVSEIVEVLHKAKLDHIIEALGLSGLLSGDVEKIKKVENLPQKILNEAINDMEKIKNIAGLNYDNVPAGKALGNAKERIDLKKKSLLSWKQILQDQVFGSGNTDKFNIDHPSDLYYVEELNEMLGFDLYEGTFEKSKNNNVNLILLDTSGSMQNEELSAAMTEIMGVKESAENTDGASEVIVLFADAEIKEDLLLINESNYHSIIEKGSINISGRGGTDMLKVINSALKRKDLKGKSISSIMYFTDLMDSPPLYKDINFNEAEKEKVSFTYISVSENPVNIEEFRSKVKDYATVQCIKNKEMEINLTSTISDQKRKMKNKIG